MSDKPKIYVFLNNIEAYIWHYVAVSQDGDALGAYSTREAGLSEVAKLKLMSQHSEFVPNYEQAYPDGYEFVWIEKVGAPENAQLLKNLQLATQNKAIERAELRAIAARTIDSIQVKSIEEVEAIRATAG